MKPVINHLIQLQELTEARAQQEATMPGTRLSQLDEAIKTLLKELPDELGLQFQKLQKKGHVAIAPITGSVCSACGMSLPVSLVHTVRAGDSVYSCPNCARILYTPAKPPPRHIGKRKRRSEPDKVGITRFSAPELMIPNLVSSTRDEAIAELCAKLEAEGFVDNGRRLIEGALKREAIASTAVDHGLAFPHVRGVEGGGLTLALAVTKKGIRFVDGTRSLTRIIFFVVIPTAASAFYLKLLSGLTQTFRKKEAREKLLAAKTPDKLWKALLSTTKTTVR